MAKLFNLKILTPEREFYNGDVEGVIVTAPDGELCILADHMPLITPIEIGEVRVKINGAWQIFSNSEGFMEVHLLGVLIFVQACERPEEIDRVRAEEALHRAEEALRQKQSMAEYHQSKIALARAMARLRLTSQAENPKND